VPKILTELEEKFLDHLIKLKKPTTSKAMAKKFIVSESRARTILKFLQEKGFTEVIEQGNIKLHKFKD
jgi:Mn-dependent DtxR family transcriptional regulator